MSSSGLTLIIKSTNDKTPNHEVSCQLSWTVRHLKSHLCATYPTHPDPASQRLIYAGKLMLDDSTLESVFKERYSGTPTIHLISRSPKPPSENPVADPAVDADPLSGITPEELEEYQREYYDYLRQFYLQNQTSTPSISTSDSSWPYATLPFCHPPYWPFVNYWTNSSSQDASCSFEYPFGPFLNNFARLPSAAHPDTDTAVSNADDGSTWFRGARAVFRGLTVANNTEDREAVDGNQPVDAQPQPPQPVMIGDPMREGFARAEEMGENAGNMDIVDRFYLLFRLCLFLGLCFAYSSLDKAIIVFSVAAYVYFYNIYRRHAAVRRAVAEAQRQPVEHPNEAAEEAGLNESVRPIHSEAQQIVIHDGVDSQVHEETITPNQPNTPAVESRPVAPHAGRRLTRIAGALRLLAAVSYQFVSSLITSLIPEQPLPIRLD